MKTLGIILMLLALVVAIGAPLYTCEHAGKSITLANGNKIPMKCFWTAMAAIAVAVPVFGLGALQAFGRRENGRPLGLVGALSGVSLILLPTALIGVCGHPDAVCNLVLRPALLLIGGVIIASNLIGICLPARPQEQMA